MSRNLKTGDVFPALWTSFVIYDEQNGRALPFGYSRQGHLGEETNRRRATPAGCLPEGRARDQPYRKLDLEPGYGEAIWSEEMFSILGLDPETTHASRSVYFERMHPDDREENLKLWHQAVDEGASIDSTHRIVRPDGTIRYVRRLGHRSPISSNAGELVGTIMDVTDNTNARQNFRGRSMRIRHC